MAEPLLENPRLETSDWMIQNKLINPVVMLRLAEQVDWWDCSVAVLL